MLNKFSFFAEAIRDSWVNNPEDFQDGICCVTGLRSSSCVQRRHIFGSSFMNQSFFNAPGSDLISIDAFQALKYKWERMSSWLVYMDSGIACFKRLDKPAIRDLVLNSVGYDYWLGYATTSFKKHGLFISEINTGSRAFWAFETSLVDCSDVEKVCLWYNRLLDMSGRGIGRYSKSGSYLENLNPPSYLIKRVGLDVWLDFRDWAILYRNSPLYHFLLWLMPSKDELKILFPKYNLVSGKNSLFKGANG